MSRDYCFSKSSNIPIKVPYIKTFKRLLNSSKSLKIPTKVSYVKRMLSLKATQYPNQSPLQQEITIPQRHSTSQPKSLMSRDYCFSKSSNIPFKVPYIKRLLVLKVTQNPNQSLLCQETIIPQNHLISQPKPLISKDYYPSKSLNIPIKAPYIKSLLILKIT